MRDQAPAGLHDRGQRLGSGHGRQTQTILRDARHGGFQALEWRQVILAQRDQHAIVAAREIEPLGGRIVRLELGLKRLRRAVLD
jgi:hypothetical protein